MTWTLVIVAVLVANLILGVLLSLSYSFLVLFWGVQVLLLAYPAIHKTSEKWWICFLGALAFFASFPLKKGFQLEGFVSSISVSLVYMGILFVAGFGWKKSLK